MIKLYSFNNKIKQLNSIIKSIKNILLKKNKKKKITISVSGGKSPKNFLQKLSLQNFDWKNIIITLIDERWVNTKNNDSNENFIRNTLLKNNAKKSSFLPLINIKKTPKKQIEILNYEIKKNIRFLPKIAILGMGIDGHTSSIFKDSKEWKESISTNKPFILIKSKSNPYLRISSSMNYLKKVSYLFLLINGKNKLNTLFKSINKFQINAISILANDPKIKLNVYWCSN